MPVIDDVKTRGRNGKALLVGGVDVMEIVRGTAAAADSIKAVAEKPPRRSLARARSLRSISANRRSSAAQSLLSLQALTKRSSAGVRTGLPSPGCDPERDHGSDETGLSDRRRSSWRACMVGFRHEGAWVRLAGSSFIIPTGGVNSHNIGEFIAAPFIHGRLGLPEGSRQF